MISIFLKISGRPIRTKEAGKMGAMLIGLIPNTTMTTIARIRKTTVSAQSACKPE